MKTKRKYKYTVISKSAWDVTWKVCKTFNNKRDAQYYIFANEALSEHNDCYNMEIKKHYKSLMSLIEYSDVVRFNDGTEAIYHHEVIT
ncbi:MAG: hypothetical protein GY804_11660 [Alphaproteobacteria bacterium]|nr:hypothetical protein [Alphaproteobacteria bacterium]